ncbi:MAG: efflux RND transporter periplasmic adaptor subunit [Alphaproteobacteria bacterium]
MAKNTKKQSGSSEAENKFQLLLTLITLLKNARHKSKKTELEFLMVNQTFNLTPYSNCVYWEYQKNKLTIKNISGLVQIDTDGPYTLWLNRVIKNYIGQNKKHLFVQDENENQQVSFSKLKKVTKEDCTQSDQEDWNKWVTNNAYLMVMRDDQDQIIGGLWLDKEKDFNSLEKAIFEDLGDGYAHALQSFDNKKNTRGTSGFSISGFKTKLFFLGLLVLMFIPVRMSATAPAEVIAKKPISINIPFDGVIDSIEVSPGQEVAAGDVLVRMDSTLLENKLSLTSGELRAAEMSLAKTERESMTDRSKLAEISILKAQLAQKRIEVEFAQEMLKLADITAERDGIVIFDEVNSLKGKPVQTGEQVMQLANLNDHELMIRIPVNSMIRINEDVPAKFFLNVNPFSSQKVEYETIGYQASQDSGGLLTYKVRGRFIDPEENIRIGWTGTGKVYGERTILGINILRRPITTLRRKLGI